LFSWDVFYLWIVDLRVVDGWIDRCGFRVDLGRQGVEFRVFIVGKYLVSLKIVISKSDP